MQCISISIGFFRCCMCVLCSCKSLAACASTYARISSYSALLIKWRASDGTICSRSSKVVPSDWWIELNVSLCYEKLETSNKLLLFQQLHLSESLYPFCLRLRSVCPIIILRKLFLFYRGQSTLMNLHHRGDFCLQFQEVFSALNPNLHKPSLISPVRYYDSDYNDQCCDASFAMWDTVWKKKCFM